MPKSEITMELRMYKKNVSTLGKIKCSHKSVYSCTLPFMFPGLWNTCRFGPLTLFALLLRLRKREKERERERKREKERERERKRERKREKEREKERERERKREKERERERKREKERERERERERKRGDINHLSVHQWLRSAIRDSQQPSATALCGTTGRIILKNMSRKKTTCRTTSKRRSKLFQRPNPTKHCNSYAFY